ncbi:hypothetical protein HCU40_12845 [Pseudanabaena biceps]|nr:hypothetical protein [Pseudanabaena biceps]
MQTLSPTISPTISRTTKSKVTETETDFSPAIAQSSDLQTALAGLDASLNDELDRYRHWQANGQTISYLNPFRPRAVSTQSIWTSPSVSEALSPITPLSDSPSVQSDRRTIQMPIMPPMGASSTDNISANLSNAELHRYRGLEDLRSLESLNEAGFSEESLDMNGYGEATNSSHSPKMAQAPLPDDDDILQGFANDYAEHYQESTRPDFEPVILQEEKSPLLSLLNPVGIVSLLLLLFSSAAIGYLMVDPSGMMKLLKPEATPKAAENPNPNAAVGSNADLDPNINLNQRKANESLSFVPFANDKNAFDKSTNSLLSGKSGLINKAIAPKDLFATPSQKSSSLFAPSSRTIPSAPLRVVPSMPLSVAPLPPSLAPIERSYSPAPEQSSYSAPAPSYTPPRSERPVSRPAAPERSYSAPSPEVVPPAPRNNPTVKYAAPLSAAPISSAPAAAASSYRVVVESGYAASAQQVERDAYVRPSDGQVQMGAYRDPNVAQQRIDELRRQGIPARIE